MIAKISSFSIFILCNFLKIFSFFVGKKIIKIIKKNKSIII